MKRLLIIFITVFCVTALFAQTKGKKTTTRKTTRTTKVDKKTQLRNEQAATQKKRKQQQQEALRLNKSIRSSLDSVLILDHNISEVKLVIDTLNHDIDTLNTRVSVLNRQVDSLKAELADKKSNYAKALVYLHRHKTVQQKLMFIFSASSLQQTVRRARYVREYSAFQHAQGEIIKEKQRQVRQLQNELLESKARLESKRSSVASQQRKLEDARLNQKKKVDFLNKNLANVQSQIKQLQKRELALNAEIDRIIREEAEAARRKAEAERKRREEAARRAAEAKRLAEAKAARERAEAEKRRAEEAARAAKTKAEREAARANEERAAAAVRTATTEVKAAESAVAATNSNAGTAWVDNSAETKLSNTFMSNKGRLPMPITGPYSIVGHFGQYKVAGLKDVTLDNKGIDIRGQQGAQARSVFSGDVTSVFQYGGHYIVMLRHGDYISVYSGLKSVSVSKGAKVSARQNLGVVGQDENGNYVLHFQLRTLSTRARLNPENWLGR